MYGHQKVKYSKEIANVRKTMANPILTYHNWTHIRRLYSVAYMNKDKFEMSDELFLAILYHDVVYDSDIAKEERSAEYAVSSLKKYEKDGLDIDLIYKMIMATSNHLVDPGSLIGLDMVILDLWDLTCEDRAYFNHGLIVRESMGLYNVAIDQALEGNLNYLENILLPNMLQNQSNMVGTNPLFWDEVIEGVERTNELNRFLLRKS